jgi:hypothetical protein
MRSAVTTAYHWLALLIALCIVVQVFLAGLGIFGAESFESHESFGWLIHTAAILLFILALIGPRSGRAIGMSFGLLALMTVQILMVELRDDEPYAAALHPVLALFVLGLAAHIGTPAISRRRAGSAPRPAR